MAWATQILSDKDFEVTVKATCTAAETEATIVDASALDGHDSSPALDIVGVAWCTTGGTLLIEFDADTDDTALALVGNGNQLLQSIQHQLVPLAIFVQPLLVQPL